MILATATPAPGLDPTMQVLLTVFGAALVTAFAGFVGAGVQSRREHTRWLKQERLAAYVAFLRVAHEMNDLYEKVETTQAEVDEHSARVAAWIASAAENPVVSTSEGDELVRESQETVASFTAATQEYTDRLKAMQASMIESSVAFKLLGPRPVAKAAEKIETTSGGSEVAAAVEALEVQMRKALGITY